MRVSIGEIVLSPKGFARWKRGHPWIYRDDLASEPPGEPAVARVLGKGGVELGWAICSPRSKIALRRIASPGELEDPRPEAWIPERIRRAAARRAPLSEATNAFRLVHAEGDGLPGLVVDRFGETLVVQTSTALMELCLPILVPALVELCGPSQVVARNDHRTRRLEGLPERIELLHGRRKERVWIHEHGIEIPVEVFTGQKTGYFLDQRPARARVLDLCRRRAGEGCGEFRVLDLCSYSGGFALHAARGGAAEVLAVDQSRSALTLLEAAAERNGFRGIRATRAKVFGWLKEAAARGERFQGIVLDPPAFAPAKRDFERARHGYRKLNARALALAGNGAWVLSCSCSAHMPAQAFRDMLAEAAALAGKRVRDRGRLPPALDHPVLLGLPEADYLKVHELEVLGPA